MTAPEDDKKPAEKQEEGTFVPPTQGLRATRKAAAAAKRAAKKRPSNVSDIHGPKKKAAAKKAPAKKAEPKAATPKPAVTKDKDHPWYTRKSYTPVPGQTLYEATGASGQIAVRSCAQHVTHAVSWAHTGWPGERATAIREGVIVTFYPDELSAKKAAAKWQEENPNDKLVVVEARKYRGQPGDKK
jgi:hypothetical protein